MDRSSSIGILEGGPAGLPGGLFTGRPCSIFAAFTVGRRGKESRAGPPWQGGWMKGLFLLAAALLAASSFAAERVVLFEEFTQTS